MKVWRKLSDNSVVGFCDEANTMFEPGGDLSTYVVSFEKTAPVILTPPTATELKKADAVVKLDTASRSGSAEDIAAALAAVRDYLT